jgi:ABC-type transport system involved in multi-copper enzyme maturation permease subunit
MIRDVFVANPIARKDLRTLMRGWRTSVLLCSYLAVMATPALIFLLRQTGTSEQSLTGANLFPGLAVIQLFLILSLTPVSVALAMRAEHTHETWDLLIMTRLSAFQIVWGKFFTGIAFHLLLALSALPLYAVALVYGTVSPADLVRTFAVLCCTVVVSGAFGLLGRGEKSVAHTSIVLGIGFMLALTALLSFLILSLSDGTHITIGSLTFTPQLTRLAPLNPLAALASALPRASATPPLSDLQRITHPFGLQSGVPVWMVYCFSCLLVSGSLLASTTVGIGRKYVLRSGKTG